MVKKNVAVVMGGYSSEVGISLQSGAVVCDAISKELYNVFAVHILKEGWIHIDQDGDEHPINKGEFSFTVSGNKIIPDVVFNTVHGTPGEDGYLAAYFELIGIPQTSTGFYQAALSFNKRDCLAALQKFGVLSATSCYVNKNTSYNIDEIINTVGLPCFVKPNRAGSSYGISKVLKAEKLEEAIEIAFTEDHEVLIETALVGVEVSVGVYSASKETIALMPTEIVSENDFFDYEAKYEGKSEEITPARISEEVTNKVRKEAIRIHTLLNMKGVTRSDFIIQDGIPYFIEINTTPGLSKESIIPKQAREAGMTLTEFFGILIENAS